jgi:two-component SAPR family response regulator
VNQKDKQDLELVHYRIDELHSKIDEIRSDMSKAHGKTDESLSFIKENLFNPNEGLWAETKLNSQFRQSTTKWRGVIGIGLIGLVIDKVWGLFT